ncbi:Por secretion system C-terminal sorting domain-containing protein [Marivirga sericea]|uniref:Por secretion system C-terminal sorting domain-containing protein n=1 Tax=Marivirga sericea TaxID=1028 RepID=A0A1X7JB11_9BACT|nr:type IX secretion system sortase PorU [Marivirga sericea]SMG25004.1 Por secretion system C-terminal sorting domain-containing protein [Marivirga sericea]
MKYFLSIILSIFAYHFLYSQSIFENGGIFKVATVHEGVHKIDLSLIESIGLNAQNINPNQIQVYGIAGGHIPQTNAIDYPYDPSPIPVKIDANQNNSFEAGESVFFYADAVQNIDFNFEDEAYQYSNNLYSDSLYFFIDFNAASVKPIVPIASNQNQADRVIDYFEAVFSHEIDETNLLRSGREWYGESFSINKSQTFGFELTGELAQSREISLSTRYMAQTYDPANLHIALNDFDLASEELKTVSDFTIFPYRQKGEILKNRSTISTSLLTSRSLDIRISHEALGAGRSDGYLDYLFLTVPHSLKLSNEQIVIRNSEFQTAGNYQLKLEGLKASHNLWDVSDLLDYKEVILQDQTYNFSQLEDLGERKFVVFEASTAHEVFFMNEVQPQVVKRNNSPDYLIIAYDDFYQVANQLADFRRNHNGYQVEVARISELFNEFGSGRRDVSAIRNYIKYYYEKNPDKLKYVLLLGASSYDYKDRVANNTNLVPVYQSRNSLHPVFTYASDDFFGFMDESEGVWEEEFSNIDDVDIGIGRIPARTVKQAKDAVDKIIHYESSPQVFNKWRNDLYFIADDEDGNLHHRDSEVLSKYVIDNFGFYNINKLYLGAFEQEVFASTQRSPKMRDALNEMVEKGALIVNYVGHGSENSWTNEAILTKSMVDEWNNLDRLPLFVTATCEYGRFDNPNLVSGAQEMLLNPNGGAIALLTTSRPVESSSNATLNRSFFEHVFKPEGGSPQKLGDIIKNTKNSGIVGVKNRNFILLGDPAVTLAEPRNSLRIEEVVNENGDTDTVNSMSKITVSGIVESPFGQKLNDFSGELTAEFYDKAVESGTIDPAENTFNFLTYDQIIYRGKSSINKGEFSFTFYVPKEIDYRMDNGKFSLYGSRDKRLSDASGFNNSFVIGGSSELSSQDNVGPDITIFLNDRSFEAGDRTGSNIELIVDLFDEHGISISNSNVNPGVTFSLDGQESVKLNDFFYYNLDSYQEGSISYDIANLDEGRHYLTITAFDVFNNKSTSTLEFEVVGEEKLSILDFVMFPNPANSEVHFRLRQNRKNEVMEFSYHVLNNQGQTIYTHSYQSQEDFREDVWNLRDKNGRKLSPGIYFVRVFLRSVEDNAKTSQFEKLIVIN